MVPVLSIPVLHMSMTNAFLCGLSAQSKLNNITKLSLCGRYSSLCTKSHPDQLLLFQVNCHAITNAATILN